MRALRAQDFKSIACMLTNCRSQILDCMSTPECRTALDCLQACAPNDQVSLTHLVYAHGHPRLSASLIPPINLSILPTTQALEPIFPLSPAVSCKQPLSLPWGQSGALLVPQERKRRWQAPVAAQRRMHACRCAATDASLRTRRSSLRPSPSASCRSTTAWG